MNEELLKNLNEALDKLLENIEGDKLFKRIQEATKEKCSLLVETNENGITHIKAEGSNIALLVNLAALEKNILKKINAPKGIYELIKATLEQQEVK